MIDFSKRRKHVDEKKSDNPIEIYNGLDRTSLAGPLRASQEKVLTEWNDEKKNNKDVIIKLHTGEGKTLIGLLVLLTKMYQKEGPCVYVCPNKYLVDQVCNEAMKFGIPVCTIGECNNLPNEFLVGNRILVTHVHKVFNGRTIFGIGNRSEKIGAIVLDDAHACLDAIRDAFVIKISRVDNKESYNSLIELFEDDLVEQGEGSFWDIKNNEDIESIMKIPYWSWIDKKHQVLKILASNEENSNINFVWPLIKNSLDTCQAFINGREIQIMPVVVPISVFGSFTNAKHRVLMSATTQDDVFFVKTLGVGISAIESPIVNNELKWSGEKMILIPSLISDKFTRDFIIEKFGEMKYKFGVVAITPTWKKQEDYQAFGCMLVDNTNIASEVQNLQKGMFGDGKIRVLTNRYDGIDLPDNACRILIIDSIPFFTNMGDKYEQQSRGESNVIRKKIAQKIEQGLGRSVRGEKDYSCIIIIGSELVSFIRSSLTRSLFSAQTQKQIDLGLNIAEWINEENGEIDFQNFKGIINQCLKRDIGWKGLYEEEMNSINVEGNEREIELAILEMEDKAEKYFLQKNYDAAADEIQKLVDNYITEESEKGWYLQLMAHYKYYSSKIESQKLQGKAFQLNYEMLKPREGISYKKLDVININRVQNIINSIQEMKSYDELMLEINRLCENLSFGTEANKFEETLNRIGEFLGFVCQRPDKTIKKGPDNLWGLGNNSFIMFECKSEVSRNRNEIYKTEVGQMNNHCGWFENEYGDASVLRIMVIPTINIAYDADFTHEVYIMRANKLKALKHNILGFFKEFKTYDLNNLEYAFIHNCLKAHQLDKDSILKKYMECPNRKIK